MIPPIFDAVNVPAVRALLQSGKGPLRFYPFGRSDSSTPMPYAVWQVVFGTPENYIGTAPDADRMGVQIDIYDTTPASVVDIAKALRDALEPHCYITSWRGQSIEADGSHRFSFDIAWIVPRSFGGTP